MTGLEHAILGLRHAIDAPTPPPVWRWLVRHRMSRGQGCAGRGDVAGRGRLAGRP